MTAAWGATAAGLRWRQQLHPGRFANGPSLGTAETGEDALAAHWALEDPGRVALQGLSRVS